jgi:diguanylate cyclase (GGDEF)-like protein
VGYVDLITGFQVSMGLLYAVPILLSARYCGRLEVLAVVVAVFLTWLIANVLLSQPGESGAVLSWNIMTRFGILVLIAYTVSLQANLRKAFERERLRADTDRLTGLLNKAAFGERVEEEMNMARRYNHPLSLAFIDLDNFKQVNDTEGHARGDLLLQMVSQTILHSIRKTDVAGRIGGDEFAICYSETGEEHIREAVGKLVRDLEIMTSQSGWQVSASIGVVTCNRLSDSYDSLLGQADQLMYLAKQRGKNLAEFKVLDRK